VRHNRYEGFLLTRRSFGWLAHDSLVALVFMSAIVDVLSDSVQLVNDGVLVSGD